MTADAGDLVQPSQTGAVAAMRLALKDAGLAPAAVAYVNAHGTGTRLNDETEAAALGEVFGATGPLVSSTKSAHGHAIGATGAIELLACLLALNEGLIAPTLVTVQTDVDCPLRLVTGRAMEADVSVCLSNAFAFGGLNAVLALRRA